MTMGDRVIDVAIIGSGFAGLAAAIESSKKVKTVVIYEKMSVPGGNSIMNGGQIAAVGSSAQKASGISDSVDLMIGDMLAAGNNLNHKPLLEKLCKQSNNIVQWTESEFGVKYLQRVTQMGGHSVPRTLSTEHHTGRDIIDPMLQHISRLPNVEVHLNTCFENFIMDDGRKRVIGIRVKNTTNDAKDAESKEIYCTQGVILAAGGFGSDIAFRKIQNPSFGDAVMSTNQPGSTSEVLRESLKAGALSIQLSHIQLGPWSSPDEVGFGKAPFFCAGAGFPYGIIVNLEGKRFVNELDNRYERSMAILSQGHPGICITDSEGAKHSIEKDLNKLKAAVKEHPSINDIAQTYEIENATALEETISNYNKGVGANHDEFGKPLRDDLLPIIKPPFYSVRLWPKVHHCMGGLHINENAQVMHVDGYPIAGLFAAGEITGGIHGSDRLGSCATLDCLLFGKVAGENVSRGLESSHSKLKQQA